MTGVDRPQRRIAHLDMDAFYASVELLRYPQLKGLPVVIGGRRRREDEPLIRAAASGTRHLLPLSEFPRLRDYVGRGVITTATYAARQFGVGSAMGIMKAARLCPDAIMLPVDFDEYRFYSQLFKAQILAITSQMENRGIDEVYIDFTDVPDGQREGGRVLAMTLQQSIFEATGLTCSIGVAPNKLLAKMASEFNKPNGISIVYPHEISTRIWPLPCRKIHGIGPRCDDKLRQAGILTIGALATQSLHWLRQHFGKSHGSWLYRAARGLDDSPVVTHSEPVSMSRETTFARDLHVRLDKPALSAAFTQLCESLADELQRKGYAGKTIGIKIRYDNFNTLTRDSTIDVATNNPKMIRQLAGHCLKRVPLEQRIRLLGVKVGSLEKVGTNSGRNEHVQPDFDGIPIGQSFPLF